MTDNLTCSEIAVSDEALFPQTVQEAARVQEKLRKMIVTEDRLGQTRVKEAAG